MGMLGRLFDPERVAVVGATERPGSVGAAVMQNLLASFDGTVVPVNPNAEAVFGLPAVSSIDETTDIDLAVVSVPADVALDVLEACGEKGVPNVVVISAGFSEVGGHGMARETRLEELAARYSMNVVGPNSLGVISTGSGLNATFGPDTPLPGHVSLLSQSGAFITAVIDWAGARSIGFNDVVSLGNKAVLDETDFLEVWGADPDTNVIVGYLEGIDDGRRFIDVARHVTAETPVLLIKAGRTDAGARAASSHTGALAGSERAYEAGLRQAGVLRMSAVEELFDAAHILAEQPVPETDTIAIVTNAGGPGVIAADAVGDSPLAMAGLDDDTIDRLHAVLPEAATTHNPIDVLGDADASRFAAAVRTVMDDAGVGMGLVLAAPTAVLSYDELAEAIVEVADNCEAAIATCFMGGNRARTARERLARAGLSCHFDPKRAIDGLGVLATYADLRSRAWGEPETFDVDTERARKRVATVMEREENRLGIEAMDLLEAYGIPIPESEIVQSVRDAERAAAEIGDRVVLKVVSPGVVHKSDIGAVAIGVEPDDVADTYERIVTRTYAYQPDATIRGVQVQEMIDTAESVETIIGMNRDPQFGPLLLFGLGGIFVEVLDDTTVRVAPISATEARAMTEEIRSAPLLRGVRGQPAVAIDQVIETIQRVSQLVTDFPAILELDINPLIATPDGVTAIDIRLTVDPEKL